MSDEWEFFFCAIDNAPASIFVDVGLHDSLPDPARSYCIVVTTYLQQPDEQGMTNDEEADHLWKLEEGLVRQLKQSADATFTGRVTVDGARTFYFYTGTDSAIEENVAQAFDQFPAYDYEFTIEHDPEWDAYFETLYPAPMDWQQIFDRQLVEQLIEAGDPLTPPREVAHYLYFNTTEGRQQFAQQAEALGFAITDQAEQPEEDHPHAIRIIRQDPVVMDHIHGVTRELLNHAALNGGIYDGWECEVIAPEFS